MIDVRERTPLDAVRCSDGPTNPDVFWRTANTEWGLFDLSMKIRKFNTVLLNIEIVKIVNIAEAQSLGCENERTQRKLINAVTGF